MTGALDPMFRMPVSFGPSPGPRNLPADRRNLRYRKQATILSVSAQTDPDRLRSFLPEGFELDGEPRVDVSLSMFTDIGWLAGRGYNILMVRFPARWRGNEEVSGQFVPVVWENMADPILTGRDELGWCKIFADIPDLASSDGARRGEASWDGFRFFEIEAEGFADAQPPISTPQPMLFQKYVPRTGEWGAADITYPTAAGRDGPPPELISFQRGSGRFAFHPARWEDMPTQYPIVTALAALPLSDFGSATLLQTSGGGDGSGQRVLK